jgi:major membrane immunogen (membrane-anchored lipoprotein)
MKNAIIIGVMAAIVLLAGCSKKSPSRSTAPPPGSKPVAYSDGSHTWYLGAVTINGTNIPATNVTIRVKPSEGSK